MLETKSFGDKFEILITDSVCWWPIYYIGKITNLTKKVANIMILPPTSQIGHHRKVTKITMSPTSLPMLAKRYPFHLTQTITYFCSIKFKEPFNYFSVLSVTEEILLSEIYLGTLRLKPLAISPQIWQFLLVLSCTSEWFWAWIFEGSCWPLGRTFVKNGPIDPCDSSSWIQLKIFSTNETIPKKNISKNTSLIILTLGFYYFEL